MYTIDSLIDKLIELEEEGYRLYSMISENIKFKNNLQIMAKVLANDEKKHILVYEEFKKIQLHMMLLRLNLLYTIELLN